MKRKPNSLLLLVLSIFAIASCGTPAGSSSSSPSSGDELSQQTIPSSEGGSSESEASSSKGDEASSSASASSSGHSSSSGTSSNNSSSSSGNSSSSSSSSSSSTSIDDKNYWSNVNDDGSVYGSSFRQALKDAIDAHGNKTCSYSSLNTILKYSDPGTSGGVQPFYRKPGTASGGWNKEHVWPNSRGAGERAGYAGTDPQVIRPTSTSDNSSRSNYMYAEHANPLTDSSSASSGWDPASFGYEPARGESARIILYAATRYFNESTAGAGGSSNGSEPLELSDNPRDASSKHTMGKLSDLLKWNMKYAVTAEEIYRNNYLTDAGYARNPFIDHPEWANYVWTVEEAHDSKYQRTTEYHSGSASAKLTSLSLSGTPTKTTYSAGEDFDPSGLTITAFLDDETSLDVTTAVTFAPSPLLEGTTSVTGSFSKGGVTKTVTVSGLTVGPAVLVAGAYSLVTDASTLKEGSELLVSSAKAGEAYVLDGNIVNSYYASAVSASIVNSQITYSSTMAKFTLGGQKGAYTLKTGSTYLNGYRSGTYYDVKYSTTPTETGSTWSFSIAPTGEASLLSDDATYLAYAESHNNFKGYSVASNLFLFAKNPVTSSVVA